MIMGSARRRVISTVAVAVLLSVLGGVGQAQANEPWWKVHTFSATSDAAGEAEIMVETTNLGDATANKLFSPVTVVDKLPPGVTAAAIYGAGGGTSLGTILQESFSNCSLATLTCTYELPVMAYERVMTAIIVKVAPGAGDGENEVSVSGGLASPVVSRQALALEGPPRPYGVESYELTPEEEGGSRDTQAGSHPFQLTTSFTMNTHTVVATGISGIPTLEAQPPALTKDLRFDLPAGLVGNPTPLPQCSTYVFTESGSNSSGNSPPCATDTVVGVATTILNAVGSGEHAPFVGTVPLYNLVPAHGEPARFGFLVDKVFPVILDTSVRTGGDYGVVVTVPNIPQVAGLIGSEVTFWGAPTDPRHDTSRGVQCLEENGRKYISTEQEEACPVNEKQPFLIMPTSCSGVPRTTLEADSWAQAGQFTAPKEYTFQNEEGEALPFDGCNRLSFEPSVNVTPDGQQGSTPTGLTVGVHVPQESELNPNGLADSTVKDTTVTLPTGVALNPAGADGLSSCSEAQVGLQSPAAIACPESSKVGTVEISTPLVPEPLVGAAYLASQDANPFGSLVALYIVVEDKTAGVLVKVAGEVKPDPVTGQLVSTFDDTPQLPFEDLKVHFFGGSRAPLGTPALCGPYSTTASIAPWSGNPSVQPTPSTFEITTGPNGSPCANPLPFDPSLTTGSLNIQAGAFTPFTMTMSREDGNQNLKAIQLQMPPGLLGELSSVKLCGEAQANAGTCGPESLIGQTTVSVGLGGNPYTVNGGEVFITGPYEGAPYGLSIVNPAKAGPFDLGRRSSSGRRSKSTRSPRRSRSRPTRMGRMRSRRSSTESRCRSST